MRTFVQGMQEFASQELEKKNGCHVATIELAYHISQPCYVPPRQVRSVGSPGIVHEEACDETYNRARHYGTVPHNRRELCNKSATLNRSPAQSARLPATVIRNTVSILLWVSVMDYSNVDETAYFEDFTVPKYDLGNHTLNAQCPFLTPQNFPCLQ